MLRKILILVAVLLILGGLSFSVLQSKRPRTYSLILRETGEVFLKLKYPRGESISSPTEGLIMVVDGKDLKEDYSNVILDIEALTYSKDVSTYESTLKLAKDQNLDPELRDFIPGYTNKTVGSHTMYFLNDLNKEASRLNGVIFENDKTVNVSYKKSNSNKAEDLISSLEITAK